MQKTDIVLKYKIFLTIKSLTKIPFPVYTLKWLIWSISAALIICFPKTIKRNNYAETDIKVIFFHVTKSQTKIPCPLYTLKWLIWSISAALIICFQQTIHLFRGNSLGYILSCHQKPNLDTLFCIYLEVVNLVNLCRSNNLLSTDYKKK